MKKWLLEKRWRIILSGTLIVTVPILGLALFVYIEISGYFRDHINEENRLAALNIATHIESELQSDIRNGSLFTTRLLLKEAVRQRDRTKITRHLKDFVDHIYSVERAFVADPKGITLANYSEDRALIGKSFSYRDWYKGVSRNWEPYVSEFFLRATTPQRPLFVIALSIRDIDNSVIGILGLQASENYIQDAISHIPAPKNQKVYVVDKKGNLIYHPDYRVDRIVDFTGYPSVRKVINGQSGVEAMKNPDGAAMLTAYEPVKQCGWGVIVQRPEQEVYASLRKLTYGLFAFTAVMIAIGASLAYRRSETIFALNRLSEELEKRVVERTAELNKTNRVLMTLSECNQALVRIEDEKILTEKICRIITEFGGYRLALVGYAEQDENKTVRVVAQSGYEDDFLEKVRLTWADTESSGGPIGRSIREHAISIFKNLAADEKYPASWREPALKRGYASAIGLPLSAGNELFGALAIYSSDAFAFDENEVKLLRELADDMAYGIMAIRMRAAHKQAEEKLAIERNRFATASVAGQVALWEWDIRSDTLEWSDVVDSMLGYEAGEFPRTVQAWEDLIHPDDRPSAMRMLGNHLEQGTPYDAEYRVRTKESSFIWWRDSGTCLRDVDGRAYQMSGACTDITERRKAEKALRESEEKYRRLVDNSLVGIFKTNKNGDVLYANKAIAALFEFDSPEGMMAEGALPRYKNPEDRKRFIQMLRSNGKVDQFEFDVLTRNGKTKTMIMSAVIDGDSISGMLIDITDYRSLEAQLHHAQKLESIGTLAGGVAHDFNNILSAIIGYGHVALMNMATDDPQRLNIEHMLEAADRAAHLTKELLLFSRKQVSERKPVDLNEVVGKVEKFLIRVIGEDITCKKSIAGHPLTVFADSYQLEQVLMNLATNARDAMPGGGAFTVTTEQINLNEDFIAAHGYGKPGVYAMITVSDTGKGMDEGTRKRIFEPFFTTKEVGKGTGLGLAVVYGIIKQHEGFINVYSEPGKGTTFRIYLSLIAPEAREEAIPHQEETPLQGTETVLLAEDDEALRKLSRTVLTKYGYTVIEAADGKDAVRRFRENKDSIQLLIFDLIMPKMNGKEAYDEIRKIKPDMKVIFSSGHAPDIIRQKASLGTGAYLIYKPLSPVELLRLVRGVLDGTI